MPDIHLFQWIAAFWGALALTAIWLAVRPTRRWRHIVLGLSATLLWTPVAYTAGNVGVASNGEVVTFGSDALALVALFMLAANILGLVLGLLLWTEEDVESASADLPAGMRRPGD